MMVHGLVICGSSYAKLNVEAFMFRASFVLHKRGGFGLWLQQGLAANANRHVQQSLIQLRSDFGLGFYGLELRV